MERSPLQNVPCTPLLSYRMHSNYSPVAVVPQSVPKSSSKCLWFSPVIPQTPTLLVTKSTPKLNHECLEVPSTTKKSTPNIKKSICPNSFEMFIGNPEKDQQVPSTPSLNYRFSSSSAFRPSCSKNRKELSKNRNLAVLPQIKEQKDNNRKIQSNNSNNLDLFDEDNDFFL